MEENSLKSAVFGGFDRQSVIDTIDKITKESVKIKDELLCKNEELARENTELHTRLDEMEERLRRLEEEKDAFASKLSQQEAGRALAEEELQRLRPQVGCMEEELARLRPEAEAYAKVKSHIGDIECAAQKRADELDGLVNERLSALLKSFRQEYQDLIRSFAASSNYALGELRKVEVNLTQLPHTFDKMNTELDDLEKVLKRD